MMTIEEKNVVPSNGKKPDRSKSVNKAQSKGSKSKQRRKRRRSRFSWRELLIVVTPTIAALVVVLIVLLVADKEVSYQLKDRGYQYYGGSSAAVVSGTTLKLTEEGNAVFSSNGNETTLPVYLENSRTVVLTSDLLYYMPRTDISTRLATFTEVRCQENGMIYVTRDGKEEKPDMGFLYDGADFYLFLEPVVVSYMGYTEELPALSYAQVEYGGEIMLFNYATKEFIINPLEGSVTAQPKSGDYSISLVGDSMTNTKGDLVLLVSRPDVFDPLV